MRVDGVDERQVVRERTKAAFVVFVYRGDETPGTSWSVDGFLVTDATLSEVLSWLADNLPSRSCWSLGVVDEPVEPTTDSSLRVSWIVGADVLNTDPQDRSDEERVIVREMLERRDEVSF